MTLGDEPTPLCPRVIKSCRACYLPISASARFCPSCGANQYPTMELEQRFSHAQSSWPKVRNLIFFYLALLASVLPILWLPSENAAAAIIVVSLVDAAIILVYWRISGIRLGPALRPSPAVMRFCAVALAALVPVLALNLGYHLALQQALGIEAESIIEPFEIAGYPFWVVLAMTCALPALGEEISFRGLIQSRLGEAVHPREAVVLTAVMFAIIHCSALSAAYLLGLGVLLGLLRQRSGSLLPGMVLHFFHNLAVVLLEKYLPGW